MGALRNSCCCTSCHWPSCTQYRVHCDIAVSETVRGVRAHAFKSWNTMHCTTLWTIKCHSHFQDCACFLKKPQAAKQQMFLCNVGQCFALGRVGHPGIALHVCALRRCGCLVLRANACGWRLSMRLCAQLQRLKRCCALAAGAVKLISVRGVGIQWQHWVQGSTGLESCVVVG